MSRGFPRSTANFVRPIPPFPAPLDGAVWRVMHCDVERKEQPVVKIPAVLPGHSGRASLRSKTGRPGSLPTALGAVDRDGRVHWSGAQYSDAPMSKYAVGAVRVVVER